MFDTIMSAASSSGAAIDPIGSAVSNWQSTKATINANEDLAKYAYKKDLEMWNLNNQYNTPAEQMRRLREAGLNPNLVYGSGKTTGNTSGEYPKYHPPRVDIPANYSPIAPAIASYIDLMRQSADVDFVKEQTKGKKIQNINEALNTSLISSRLAHSAFDLKMKNKLENIVIGTKEQELQNKQQMHLNLEAVNANYKQAWQLKEKQMQYLQQQITAYELDNYLRDKGVSPNDRGIMRFILMQLRGDENQIDFKPGELRLNPDNEGIYDRDQFFSNPKNRR